MKMKNKTMTVFFAMLIGFAVMFIGTEQVCAMEGNGSANSPYRITNYADLKEFAAVVNNTNAGACAILKDDIQCVDEKWVPIGTDSRPYTGTFDGQRYIIKNLSNKKSDVKDHQGLFGVVGSRAKIQNVGLKGVYIQGNNKIGAVAGENKGTITNCYNTGDVNGNSDIGGVVGYNNNYATVSHCYNTGYINGKQSVGGVAGESLNATITNCYNTGDVNGNNFIGGVAGDSAYTTITNCYNTGNISGNLLIGGVAGQNSAYGTITNCYNTGDESGYRWLGGVTGRSQANSTTTNCYSAGNINGKEYTGQGTDYDYIGGVIGNNVNGTVRHCYYDSTICSAAKAVGEVEDTDNVKGLRTAEMTGKNCTAYDSWVGFYTVWRLTYMYPILDPHDHKLTYEKEQTCVAPGHVAGYTCSICGKHYSDENGRTPIPDANWNITITGHTWSSEWSVDGNKHWHECTKCGARKDESAHVWKFEEFVWNGYASAKAYYTCECDDSRVKRVTATITEETTDPTCTEAGKTTYTVTISAQNSLDGFEHQESRDAKATEATGHKYGAWTKLDANQHQRVCEHDPAHIETADHVWNSGEITEAATTTATGIMTFTCTECGYMETKTIPMLAKQENPLTIKGKTATVKGSTKGKKGKLKKTRTLAVTKVIAFTKKGQGQMTYTKASGTKKIVINKTTGKVTVKKGLKKGTYKISVQVKAAGNDNYNASPVKTVTFKIRVK